MPGRRRRAGAGSVNDYRHEEARRKNNPPVGIAATYEHPKQAKTSYSHEPHLDPQLVWSGKAEHTSFDVDVVSLHIHERISTQAILRAVRRPEPLQLKFFGETPLSADQQIEFYKHDVDWANRLILGDSLLVMNSLLVKEGMAGKVQMIYMDPPYGIKYSSNFQPRIDRRDVKDKDEDLTHEPEQIKAYRDTWKLGIHSYLTYLRDRLLLCRELLHESGSVFVQINDENVHRVRCIMDEVFGGENFISHITYRTKNMTFGARYLEAIADFILWYAKDKPRMKYHQLFKKMEVEGDSHWNVMEFEDGRRETMMPEQVNNHKLLPKGVVDICQLGSLYPAGVNQSGLFKIFFRGKEYTPPLGKSWKTNETGMKRIVAADRLEPYQEGKTIRYVMKVSDYPVSTISSLWHDTPLPSGKRYVVETSDRVIERCILMTTDPGDLVFDPTCGSGTTAYCAEKWGRRWITCDTSRVALAIARQRLMTARFDYYELREPAKGPAGGFLYESVPHITLESIARNAEIDDIAAKHQPRIDEALAGLNRALSQEWKEWEVPREVDPAWPSEAKEHHKHFWQAKRQKREEIDESIRRNAPEEVLYDRQKVRRGVVRVSGPFTVEAIPVPAIEDPATSPIPQFEAEESQTDVLSSEGHITTLLNLLRKQGGVVFPGGKRMELQDLRPINAGMLHAEATTKQNGGSLRVAVSFGPQYGPVTAFQVREAIPAARMNGYDILVFAGFSFDPEVHALVQKVSVQGLQVHFANIAPDVFTGDLLKTSRASQIFTVFGQPDVAIMKRDDDKYVVELRGVDIYDPVSGEVHSCRGTDVAAWFLDTDYDGMTFHICQAFFPGDPDAWEKLQRALKATIKPEMFERMRGTMSFPFKAGMYRRVAVKVVDFRGNEVIRVLKLEPERGASLWRS